MAWTVERIDLLKKLWSEGKSCSEIAARLPGKSRNAVIGKVHRLGLPERATTVRKKPVKRQRYSDGSDKRRDNGGWRIATGPKAAMAPTDIETVRRIESANDIGRVTFDELQDHHCRYVVGDPRAEYKFCGDKKIPGLSYCYGHASRCYTHTERQRNATTPHRGPVDEALETNDNPQPAREKETV